ncbi:hypothetical protein [Oleidesulfovibrio sp.]|uniref:hypothetical protein n=1 Tax=Oleidesulfovibrio sp. TaxID=2909707 RepID=UPI003A8625D2
MKKLLLLVGVLGVIIVGLVVTLVLSINPIIEKAVNTFGPELTKANVSLNKADVSFMSGKGSLEGFMLGNPAGFKSDHAMKVDGVLVKIDKDSLTKDTIVIHLVEIVNPDIIYEKSGRTDNFTALLNNVKKSVASDKSPQAPAEEQPADADSQRKVIIDNFIVRGGNVSLTMAELGGKGISAPLPDIHLKDIGREKQGATPAEALEKIFGALNDAVGKAATSGIREATKGITEGLGKGTDAVKEQGGKMGDAVKNLFN